MCQTGMVRRADDVFMDRTASRRVLKLGRLPSRGRSIGSGGFLLICTIQAWPLTRSLGRCRELPVMVVTKGNN